MHVQANSRKHLMVLRDNQKSQVIACCGFGAPYYEENTRVYCLEFLFCNYNWFLFPWQMLVHLLLADRTVPRPFAVCPVERFIKRRAFGNGLFVDVGSWFLSGRLVLCFWTRTLPQGQVDDDEYANVFGFTVSVFLSGRLV